EGRRQGGSAGGSRSLSSPDAPNSSLTGTAYCAVNRSAIAVSGCRRLPAAYTRTASCAATPPATDSTPVRTIVAMSAAVRSLTRDHDVGSLDDRVRLVAHGEPQVLHRFVRDR